MYSIKKVKKYDLSSLLKVSEILYQCGKDMADKCDLHHWDNSHIKNWIIVAMCAMKNDVYLVLNESVPVATFQTRKVNSDLLFQKLATSPKFSRGGIGSFCLTEIEEIGKERECSKIICEVYEKSKHAIGFYEKRGYTVYGCVETLKYKELKLRKEL